MRRSLVTAAVGGVTITALTILWMTGAGRLRMDDAGSLGRSTGTANVAQLSTEPFEDVLHEPRDIVQYGHSGPTNSSDLSMVHSFVIDDDDDLMYSNSSNLTAPVRDHWVQFVNWARGSTAITSLSWSSYDYFIMGGQPFHGVEAHGNKIKIRCGPTLSTGVANKWASGLLEWQQAGICELRGNFPSKLHFFLKFYNFTIEWADGGTRVFGELRLGQGHRHMDDNWHVGSSSCLLRYSLRDRLNQVRRLVCEPGGAANSEFFVHYNMTKCLGVVAGEYGRTFEVVRYE